MVRHFYTSPLSENNLEKKKRKKAGLNSKNPLRTEVNDGIHIMKQLIYLHYSTFIFPYSPFLVLSLRDLHLASVIYVFRCVLFFSIQVPSAIRVTISLHATVIADVNHPSSFNSSQARRPTVYHIALKIP
jgi:hypothetical protein